jgi:hypothetical protein
MRRLVVWGTILAMIVLILYLFRVTPGEILFQINRCITCH